jgi:hypothetical protein
MTIIYTGTPPNIKVNGIPFHTGQPVEVPDMVAELLLKKPCFTTAVEPSFDGGPMTDPYPKRKNKSDKGE